MTRVAIIPARGGSTRIPRKNIRDFEGQPIIAYSIQTAKASGLFERGIWVSTDDPEIAKVAWGLGVHVHPRQPELARDEIGTQQVMREALRELFPVEANRPAIACCIYPCAPLMLPEDLKRGLEALVEGPTPYAYSVDRGGGDAGQWYWGLTSAFVEGVPLEHPRTKLLVLPSHRTCDINTEADWQRALLLYRGIHENAAR